MTAKKLTHLDDRGRARMVDVGDKERSAREARASATLRMSVDTMQTLLAGDLPKGDAFATARIAAIQAAKRTSELIPMCHPLAITGCDVHFETDADSGVLTIEARVGCADRTGVEMEALTAATVAALTMYDMLKALDREMTIESVMLLEKSGGRSGHFRRE